MSSEDQITFNNLDLEKTFHRLKRMLEMTKDMEKTWLEMQGVNDFEDLTPFQKGVICGRMDVLNFLRDKPY